MRYIIRLFSNCYEELIRYYPRFYMDVREMVAILSAYGRVGDMLYDAADAVYSNNFIDGMDEYMISQLEKFLGLNSGGRTLEERRALIKTYFVGFGKISATVIREIIAAFADVNSDIVFEPLTEDEHPDHALFITIYQDEDQNVDTKSIFEIVGRRLPAHIWYNYNTTIRLLVDSMVERAFLTSMVLTFQACYGRRLNGDWILDGSWLLGAECDPIHTSIINRYISTITETFTVDIAAVENIVIDSMVERAFLTSMTLTFRALYGRRLNHTSIITTCRSELTESAIATVTAIKDLWLLDGSYNLNGEKLLDAEITFEEVI